MNAPVCVAKGVDLIARKIRDVAREHDVPVVENRSLARALHGTVEVDQEIPPEHCRAVAEVIGYIMRLRCRGRGAAAVKRAAKPLASGGRPGHHISTGQRRGDDESVGFRVTMGHG
jgi:type III secretion system FlhB-like substrate exporter